MGGIMPIMNGGPAAPLEGDDVSHTEGMRDLIGNAEERTLGQTFINKTMGDLAGGQNISQQDAVAQLKQQNYDTTGIPDSGITEGALTARMNRASYLKQTEDDANRAQVGSTGRFVAGLVGGLGDPANALVAPLGAFGTGARLGLGMRAATGAAEGVIYSRAQDEALNHMNMGDPDLTSADMLKDMTMTAIGGGILHSAFGPRPVAVPGGGDVTLDMIDRLGEKTGSYAKAHGMNVDDVVSNKGAVGRYQLEPGTAIQMGADPAAIRAGMLRDPTFNAKYAQKYLDYLNKRYPGDPEAVAIAYNGGPGRADAFLRRGRDYSILPKETVAYAQRMNGVPRDARVNALQTAYTQLNSDSPVNVKPVIDGTVDDTYRTNPFKIQDEHDLMMEQLHTEGMQAAVPKRDSIYTESDSVKATLDKIDQTIASTPKPVEAAAPVADTEPGPAQSVAAVKVDPELQQLHANDVAEAEGLGQKMGPPQEQYEAALAKAKLEGPEADLAPHLAEVAPKEYEAPEEFKIDGLSATEHQKAVDAAVRCSAIRGTE